MSERFRDFMDSAPGFWTLIGGLLVFGFAYMLGAHRLIEWYMRRRVR